MSEDQFLALELWIFAAASRLVNQFSTGYFFDNYEQRRAEAKTLLVLDPHSEGDPP